jgi:hypothetical protein
MQRRLLKSRIHQETVTSARLVVLVDARNHVVRPQLRAES